MKIYVLLHSKILASLTSVDFRVGEISMHNIQPKKERYISVNMEGYIFASNAPSNFLWRVHSTPNVLSERTNKWTSTKTGDDRFHHTNDIMKIRLVVLSMQKMIPVNCINIWLAVENGKWEEIGSLKSVAIIEIHVCVHVHHQHKMAMS